MFISAALLRLGGEEKESVLDVIPLNFLYHVQDTKKNQDFMHSANMLYKL